MSIYKKLLDFQKLGISIKKGSVNPHFKNKYADINEVLEKVKPALSSVGLLLVQTPRTKALLTQIMDPESDTWIESHVPYINTPDMQKLGSAITYARRYALVAMLGLEDDDDDGNQAAATQEPTTNLRR